MREIVQREEGGWANETDGTCRKAPPPKNRPQKATHTLAKPPRRCTKKNKIPTENSPFCFHGSSQTQARGNPLLHYWDHSAGGRGGLGSPSGGRGGTPHLNNGAVQVAGFWPGAKCLAENPSQMAKSVTLATFFGKKLSKKAEYFPPVLSYFFKILDGVREVREGWVKVPSSHLCTHVHPYMASIRLFLRVYVDASS